MISLRLPAGRAYPGAFRRLLAEREARSLSLATVSPARSTVRHFTR